MCSQFSLNNEALIEKVCSICPATFWGEKNICRVNNIHVGEVNNCPEWEKHTVSKKCESKNHTLSIPEEEPDEEIIQRMEETIKDYQYMILEIARLQSSLNKAGNIKVGQYIVDNSPVLGKGRISDPTSTEVARRERKWKRLENLQATVQRIHRAVDTINDEKERIVIDALLDGEKNSKVANQLRMSRQTFYDIKRAVISKMAAVIYLDEKCG